MTRQIARILTLRMPRCQERFGAGNCTAGRVESGAAQAGSANTLQLRAGASAVDDAFNSMTARLEDGTGRERRISDYVGATKVATVESAWPYNDLTKASEIDHADWTKQNSITITANYGLAPDGQMKADRVQTNVSGVNLQRYFQTFTGYAGKTACFSFKMRSLNGGNQSIRTFLREVGFGTTYVELVATVTPEWGLFHMSAAIPGGSAGVMALVYDASSQKTWDILVCDHQVNEGTEPVEYIETDTTAILLPTASTPYTIIDRPNTCYNTRRTCQDTAHFSLGHHGYRLTFTDDEIPAGTLARPYLTKVEHSPTQLDFEAGLGRRSDTRATAIDEADADVEQDPYVRDRAVPAGGTYWRRMRARNLHYAGHPAELATYEIVDGVWGTPIVEHFLIGALDGPDKTGLTEILLKDPTSALDTVKTPPPTTGKLVQALGLNDLQAVLEVGDGAQYGASGWFRHNKEVIRFTSRVGDTLFWPDGTHRAQFGTSAQAGKVGDALQICHVGIDEIFNVTVKRLFNGGGMPDAQLDLAGLAAEQTAWLPGYDKLTYCVAEPETTSTLVKELMLQAGMASCWSSEQQKQIFRAYAPKSPAALVPKVLTGAGHLLLDSVEVRTLDDERLTRMTIRFGLAQATAALREDNSYLTGEGVVRADAESPSAYGDVREKVWHSRWFDLASRSAMRTLVRRTAARYVDAPQDILFFVDPKDQDLEEGDVVDLTTAKYVDIHGAVKQVRVIITRKHRQRRHGVYSARITAFGDRRYAFIAPNGTPDYPDNAGYACIASAAGLMSDGTDGYRIW